MYPCPPIIINGHPPYINFRLKGIMMSLLTSCQILIPSASQIRMLEVTLIGRCHLFISGASYQNLWSHVSFRMFGHDAHIVNFI